jgi:hypothetical protein
MRISLVRQKINKNRHVQRLVKGFSSKIRSLLLSQKTANTPRYPIWRIAVSLFILISGLLFLTAGKEPVGFRGLKAVAYDSSSVSEHINTLPDNVKLPKSNLGMANLISSSLLNLNLARMHLPEVSLTNMHTSNTNLPAGDVSQRKINTSYTEPGQKKENNLHKIKVSDQATSHEASLPEEIRIAYCHKTDGDTISTHLFLDGELPVGRLTYLWDLGDGKKSYEKTIAYTYPTPGHYQAQLQLCSAEGVKVKSNVLNIRIPADASGLLPAAPQFITLNKAGDLFYTKKRIKKVEDFLNQSTQPVKLVKEENGEFCYQGCESGYYSLLFTGDEAEETSYLFVSPLESVHSDRTDCNWYRTQYNTGLSNCGPATVSIGVGWAKGNFVEVKDIRAYIGWQGNGATSFADLRKSLTYYGVNSSYTDVRNKSAIFNLIDRGNIAIVLYKCGAIPLASRPEIDLVGRYYVDNVGHYIVIKGYSTDKAYFIVYDPIPSDWNCNGKRYGDGISMLGRNRYYAADALMKSILAPYVLEITRAPLDAD